MPHELIEPGTYRARAREADLGIAGTGTEQVAVLFELLDLGVTRTWYGYFSEKTQDRTIKSLRIAGWTGSDLTDLSELNGDDVPEVNVVVEHDTDQNGVVRDRIRWVNGTGGLALNQRLNPDQKRALAAKMRGRIAALDAAAKTNGDVQATPAAKAKKNGGAAKEADEIPF